MGVLSILYIEGCNVRFSAHKIYTTVDFFSFFAYIRTEEKKNKNSFFLKMKSSNRCLGVDVVEMVLGGVVCVCIYGKVS